MRAFKGCRLDLRECARGLAASCARSLKSAGLRTSMARNARLLSRTTPPMPSAEPYSNERAPAAQQRSTRYEPDPHHRITTRSRPCCILQWGMLISSMLACLQRRSLGSAHDRLQSAAQHNGDAPENSMHSNSQKCNVIGHAAKGSSRPSAHLL